MLRASYAVLLAPTQVYCMNLGLGRPGVAVGLQYFFLYSFGTLASIAASSCQRFPMQGTMLIIALLVCVAFGAFLFLPKELRRDKSRVVEDLSAGELE